MVDFVVVLRGTKWYRDEDEFLEYMSSRLKANGVQGSVFCYYDAHADHHVAKAKTDEGATVKVVDDDPAGALWRLLLTVEMLVSSQAA